jgi:membrane-associated phospholipid phosphatase
VAIVVLAVSSVAVSDQTFLHGETALLEAANDIPTTLGWPLRIVMQLGTLWVALAVVAVTAWATRARGVGPALAVAIAAAIAFRLDNVLKDIIERPRPPGLVAGLHVRETISGFGFPSGHTTMAFALAASLHAAVATRWRWVVWTLAAVVGVARMHVGVHWPADVIGGAALGIAIGTTAWLLVAVTPSRGAGRR